MEEEALLVLPEEKERKVVGKWKEFVGEMKKVGSIATPMVVVTVSQYLLQVVSMSMAGHLGEISLSSAAIATSLTNFGMAGALETLCGQAYGAEQYKKLGIYTYAAIVSLLLVFRTPDREPDWYRGVMEEEALLVLPEESERKVVGKWKEFVGEMKKVGSIATPMVVVTVSQYLLQVVSMSMAGHLGEISLSSAAIATSFTNFGMAGALETLCGQAYGAEQYKKLGIYTYAAIVSLLLVCLPVSVLWIFLDKLLLLLGQDPLISQRAGKYVIWLIPALFPYAILQSLVRYLQTQSLILAMLLCSVATLFFHIPLCWVLVFKLKMGNSGAALAIGLSYWLNAILLGFYLKYSSSVERTRTSFSRDVFLSIGEFIRFAVPSAIMATSARERAMKGVFPADSDSIE
ncbi:hypothetical protein C3L33_18621, partial [Rhododendron williamsianum]